MRRATTTTRRPCAGAVRAGGGPTAGASVEDDVATRLFVATGDDLAAWPPGWPTTTRCWPAPTWRRSGPPGPAASRHRRSRRPKRLELARKVVDRGQAVARAQRRVVRARGSRSRRAGKVAFAFPGIEPTFDARVDDVAAPLRGRAPSWCPARPTSSGRAPTSCTSGGCSPRPSARLRVRPDVVVGHSLGEWTAMLVAEAVTREAIDRFVHGIADGDLVLPDLVFLALGCGVDVAEAAIAGLPDIAVSHDNCPHQVIVCGSEASVAVAQERLKAQRVLGQVLPFRTGFHTPMFADYLQPFEDALGTLPLHRRGGPDVLVGERAARSPTTRRACATSAGASTSSACGSASWSRTSTPTGVRVFVQPGVGSVAGFVGDTLHDREHLAVAGAAPKRSGMAQLTRVAAALFVEGADVPPGPRWRRQPRRRPARGAVRRRVDRPARARARGRASPSGRRRRPDAAAVPLGGAALRLVARPGRAPAARRARPPRPASPLGRRGARVGRRAAAPTSSGPRCGGVRGRARGDGRPWRPGHRAAASAAGAGPHPAGARRPPRREPATGRRRRRPRPLAAAAPTRHHERRRLSLAEVPELIDHAFFIQRDGTGTVNDRFPVVPMTMMIQMFVDTATQPRRRTGRRRPAERPGPALARRRAAGRGRHHGRVGGARPGQGRRSRATPGPPSCWPTPTRHRRHPTRRPLTDERPPPHTAARALRAAAGCSTAPPTRA